MNRWWDIDEDVLEMPIVGTAVGDDFTVWGESAAGSWHQEYLTSGVLYFVIMVFNSEVL